LEHAALTDRPKTFAEVVAAEDPAERERMERAETVTDGSVDATDFRAVVTVSSIIPVIDFIGNPPKLFLCATAIEQS
jgi:hypothetical protein